MKLLVRILPFLLALPLAAQSTPPSGVDPWKALSFLQGTWSASTSTAGSSGGNVSGTYTFRPELGNHILARHTTSIDGCKGPATFDCDHERPPVHLSKDAPGQSLKAIYFFDNEGHVIHYDVSTPDAKTALFLSDASPTWTTVPSSV